VFLGYRGHSHRQRLHSAHAGGCSDYQNLWRDGDIYVDKHVLQGRLDLAISRLVSRP
jgi:hypothetical protein